MAVPVKTNRFALLINYSAHKFHYFARAIRRGVANCIADTHGACAAANRGGVERANRFGIGARGVFGDKHHRQAFVYGKRHRVFGHFQEFIQGPCFRVETNRRGSDKGAGFDGNSGALRNLHNRNNVIAVRARGAVGPDAQPLFGDLAGH